MDDVSEQTDVRAVDGQRAVRPLRATRDGAADMADHNDRDADGSYIGDYIDPEADYVPREWEPKHIGDRLDPDAPVEFGGTPVVSHIGQHFDPDDDWRRPRHDTPRYIGEPQEPDYPPLVDPSASHIGERMEPPDEL